MPTTKMYIAKENIRTLVIKTFKIGDKRKYKRYSYKQIIFNKI